VADTVDDNPSVSFLRENERGVFEQTRGSVTTIIPEWEKENRAATAPSLMKAGKDAG
jgi:hypothetical protein